MDQMVSADPEVDPGSNCTTPEPTPTPEVPAVVAAADAAPTACVTAPPTSTAPSRSEGSGSAPIWAFPLSLLAVGLGARVAVDYKNRSLR
jgi:hypothetical protein